MRIDIKLYYLSRILYYIVCKNSIIFCDILLKKQKSVQNAVFTTNFKKSERRKSTSDRNFIVIFPYGSCILPAKVILLPQLYLPVGKFFAVVGDGALRFLTEIKITMRNAPETEAFYTLFYFRLVTQISSLI